MKPSELCTCLIVSCFCFSGESLEFLKHFLPTWTQYFSVRLNKSVERREIAGRQLCTSLAPIVQQHWEGESWSWAFLPTGYNSLWRVSSLDISGHIISAMGLVKLILGGGSSTCGFYSESLQWKSVQDKSCQKYVSLFLPLAVFNPFLFDSAIQLKALEKSLGADTININEKETKWSVKSALLQGNVAREHPHLLSWLLGFLWQCLGHQMCACRRA